MRITTYGMEFNESKNPILVKERSFNYPTDEFDNPQDIYLLMTCDKFRLDKQAEEHLYMFALNAKNRILGVFEVSHGVADTSFCNPREILIRALLCGATSIILVHNHPSGISDPSKEDVVSAKKVLEAGKIVGISLLDSIIVGDYMYSLRQHSDVCFA